MRRIKSLTVLGFLALVLTTNVKAADDRPLHEVHSMMLFNFAKYVNWPANNTSGEFVIGVLGSDDVFNTLTAWYTNKAKGSQKIVIRKFDSASAISDCEVLYLAKEASKEFDDAKSKLNGKSTLLISDKEGLGKRGSGINFKLVDGKLKFELNEKAITDANLKVSSQLMGMAIVL